jgi:hypothetical protein
MNSAHDRTSGRTAVGNATRVVREFSVVAIRINYREVFFRLRYAFSFSPGLKPLFAPGRRDERRRKPNKEKIKDLSETNEMNRKFPKSSFG